MLRAAFLASALVAAVAVLRPAGARPMTTVALKDPAGTSSPLVPPGAEWFPPAACVVAPRTAEEVAAIVAVASPVAEFRSVDDATDLPQGVPADAETVAAVTAVAREYAGCLNAGDYPRALALLSERSLRAMAASGYLADLLAQTGTPSADERGVHVIKRITVSEVRVLPDGRVGAVIEWVGENVGEANFDIYVQEVGRWLMDDEISGFVWPP